MRTRAYQYPPAKFVFGEPGRTGMAINSIVAAGTIVSGAVVRNSVVSHDVRVNSYADVDSSIIFSHVNIGRHCRIRHAIIDRDVHIPDGTVIGYDPNEDKRKQYFVSPTPALTVVTRDYSVYENPVSPEFMQTALILLLKAMQVLCGWKGNGSFSPRSSRPAKTRASALGRSKIAGPALACYVASSGNAFASLESSVPNREDHAKRDSKELPRLHSEAVPA